MENEYTFQLSKVLKYSVKGKFEETATIIFEPPNMDCFDEASDFEQMFMGSLITAGNVVRKDKEEEQESDKSALEDLKDNIPSASDIKMLIHISQEIKVKDLYRSFRKLACKSGKLDDNTKLKKDHFDKISRDDAIRMICEYTHFFTFPSLLGGGSQEKSGSQPSVT